MNFAKNTLVAALVGAALVGYAGLPARAGNDLAPAVVMSPLKAKTFDMGNKRAVAFYQSQGHACKVSVLVADRLDEAGIIPSEAVRFDSNVASGTSARVGTANGPDLNLSCAANAANLKIETLNRVAYQLSTQK